MRTVALACGRYLGSSLRGGANLLHSTNWAPTKRRSSRYDLATSRQTLGAHAVPHFLDRASAGVANFITRSRHEKSGTKVDFTSTKRHFRPEFIPQARYGTRTLDKLHDDADVGTCVVAELGVASGRWDPSVKAQWC